MEQAQKAEHPFLKQALLPDRILTSMFAHSVSKFRRRQMEYWTGRAAELEAYEQEVQEGLHGSVKECLKGKRTELLKEMLVEARRVPSFGARNSVYTFGTIAFALSCVLVSLFKLSLTQYVDDFPHFPQVEPRASASLRWSARQC